MSETVFNAAFLISGVAGLYFGADFLVKGGAALARRAGVSPLVIGLTLVAFATSAPELVVSVSAALQGNTDIALGNVVGSNICNIALILGVSACISPLAVQKQVFRRDAPVMLAASLILCGIFFVSGGISRIAGIVLALLMIVYNLCCIFFPVKEGEEEEETAPAGRISVPAALFLTAAGFAMLIAGAKVFLWGAVFFAKLFEVSDAVIGLTVVAVGTSLPELATSIVAAAKGEADIAIGNVVGSNIFNILGILGITAALSPVTGSSISMTDMAMMLFCTVIIMPQMRSGWVISRTEGLLLVLIYCVYSAYLFI